MILGYEKEGKKEGGGRIEERGRWNDIIGDGMLCEDIEKREEEEGEVMEDGVGGGKGWRV